MDASALAHRVIELERLLNLNDPSLKGLFHLSVNCSNLLGLLLNNDYVPTSLKSGDVGVLRVTVQRLRGQLAPYGLSVHSRWGVGYYLSPADKAVIWSRLKPQLDLPLPEPRR